MQYFLDLPANLYYFKHADFNFNYQSQPANRNTQHNHAGTMFAETVRISWFSLPVVLNYGSRVTVNFPLTWIYTPQTWISTKFFRAIF